MKYNQIKHCRQKCSFCWFLLHSVYHNARFKKCKVC